MRPGETIARRFVIERRVGAGAMGTVYRAIDAELGNTVAVKPLDIRTAHDAERFYREAAVLAELSHPGIVRYVAHGKSEGGAHFIAMEWLQGGALSHPLRGEERLSCRDTIRLGIHVAEALTAAHKSSIVHRDIKPANLFLVDRDIDRVK